MSKERPRLLRTMPEPDWKPIAGVRGRLNARLSAALLHVMHQVPRGGRYEDQYDQPLLIESPAVIVVATLDDAVGLVENYRMTRERPRILHDAEAGTASLGWFAADAAGKRVDPASFGTGYAARVAELGLLDDLLAGLGRYAWECPAGNSPGFASDDLERFLRKTALAEAGEEGGFEIDDILDCGTVNLNSTYFAHPQHVVRARVVRVGAQRPEDTETVGRMRFFSREELRVAMERGAWDGSVFDDGKTFAALAKSGVLR